MPACIFPYLIGILQGYRVTTTFLQFQFGFSHDRLTRTLQKSFNWRWFLFLSLQKLFGFLQGGYLILDDTVIAKPHAKVLEGAGFVYSSSLERTVYGYAVVLLVWTNGRITLPLSWRWSRRGGGSRVYLAAELLEEAKYLWGLKPKAVVFDSWYAAAVILEKINTYGWEFVSQMKKNRVVNAAPIEQDLTEEGDALVGALGGGGLGRIVRHDGKFFATNNLRLKPREITDHYGYRWSIEEVFRFLKGELHLEECQARSRKAQETHLFGCLLSYLILQKEQQESSKISLYAIKRVWLINPPIRPEPSEILC